MNDSLPTQGQEPPQWGEVRKRIAKARRHLNAALGLARDVPFTQDDRELLHDTVGQVRDAASDLATRAADQ